MLRVLFVLNITGRLEMHCGSSLKGVLIVDFKRSRNANHNNDNSILGGQ